MFRSFEVDWWAEQLGLLNKSPRQNKASRPLPGRGLKQHEEQQESDVSIVSLLYWKVSNPRRMASSGSTDAATVSVNVAHDR